MDRPAGGTVGRAVVTGGDGYLGQRMAHALLARGEAVTVVVRDPSRRPPVMRDLEAAGATVHAADLAEPGSLAGLVTDGVTRVVHTAALTRFDVDHLVARRVNVNGTRRVLALARRCPDLEAFGLVSTLYSSGLAAGPIEEDLGDDGAGFANQYEWSKWEAERVAADEFADLPVSVIRLATIIADDAHGTVSQRNAFHTTLRLVHRGLLSLLPGDPATPLHLISGRYAVEGTVAVLDAATPGTYHLTNDPSAPITLGDLVDLAWARFEADPEFVRRGVLRPLFTDADSFTDLASASESFAGSFTGRALSTTAPFARQLYVAKEPVVRRARAVLAPRGVHPDEVHGLVRAAIDHVVTTRWGRTDARAA